MYILLTGLLVFLIVPLERCCSTIKHHNRSFSESHAQSIVHRVLVLQEEIT